MTRCGLALLLPAMLACEARTPEAAPPPVNEVSGHAAAAVRGVPSVILLHPLDSASPAFTRPPLAPVIVDQIGMAFSPRMIVVRPGQDVEFRNSEDVAHNVTVRDAESGATVFNESPIMGEAVSFRFDTSGEYSISCDIHPGMTAFVLVADAPYTAVAQADGAFALAGVLPGVYRLSVWSRDPSQRVERTVEISTGRTRLSPDLVP